MIPQDMMHHVRENLDMLLVAPALRCDDIIDDHVADTSSDGLHVNDRYRSKCCSRAQLQVTACS